MSRAVLIAAVVLAVLAPAAGAHARPKARAIVASCDRTEQAAVFVGRIDAVPGAVRMQMRFRLEISTPDEPAWSRVAVPGFSSWVTSDPNRSRYVYEKRVEALLAPAAYRVQLRFRWLDTRGAVVRSATARSRTCRQPDPRPDLRVPELTAATDGGGPRFDLVVRNLGRGAADASTVALRFPDGTTLRASVPPMVAAGREDVFLSGPRCPPGETVEVTADADDVVDEADEDNVAELPCPAT
jgi:hypothetical protein